jgi:hypothetical protein
MKFMKGVKVMKKSLMSSLFFQISLLVGLSNSQDGDADSHSDDQDREYDSFKKPELFIGEQ